MKEINKTKLVMAIILILVICAVITLIVISVNQNKKEQEEPLAASGSISETESEFEELKVKDIELSYAEDDSETILNFSIENITDEKVEQQKIDIYLLDEDGGLISAIQTYVEAIEPNDSRPIPLKFAGKIQGIKTIKLVQPQEAEESEEE